MSFQGKNPFSPESTANNTMYVTHSGTSRPPGNPGATTSSLANSGDPTILISPSSPPSNVDSQRDGSAQQFARPLPVATVNPAICTLPADFGEGNCPNLVTDTAIGYLPMCKEHYQRYLAMNERFPAVGSQPVEHRAEQSEQRIGYVLICSILADCDLGAVSGSKCQNPVSNITDNGDPMCALHYERYMKMSQEYDLEDTWEPLSHSGHGQEGGDKKE